MFFFIKNFLSRYIPVDIIKRIYLDTGSAYLTILLYTRISKILVAIGKGEHDLAYTKSSDLLKSGYAIGNYYQAKVLFLLGNSQDAKSKIECFLSQKKFHAEANYLLADILFFLNKKNVAWDNLLSLLKYSTRKKTWQYLAKFVSNEVDFETYHSVLLRKYPTFLQKPSYDLLLYYTDAAFRCHKQGDVVWLWKLLCSQKIERNTYKAPVKNNSYSTKMAEIALADIKKVFDGAGIPFFLISGTLLGCVREGCLLSHDKDIDLGVWNTITSDDLVSIIRRSGCFYILPSTTENLVVIRHLNGVSIDVFIHYRSVDDYYHLGVKCSWHNTPFTLVKMHFMNDVYLIPENYNLYLIENYGNWKTPKINFDSAIDTPNMSIVDENLMKIYFYKKIYHAKDILHTKKYLKALDKLTNE